MHNEQTAPTAPVAPTEEKGQRAAEIHRAYNFVGGWGSQRYDAMMSGATWLGRLALRLFWQLSPAQYEAFLTQMFAGLPRDFAGRLLEVPVGTGVLSLPHYVGLPQANITCLDYSEGMLAAARQRAHILELDDIHFQQGDVGALPFADDSFDLVLSVNGLHAFPDKEAALREIQRVLRPGGTFTGCLYIRGESRITDLFVRTFCTWRGYFTPPYEDYASLRTHLGQYFPEVSLTRVASFAGFTCHKKT